VRRHRAFLCSLVLCATVAVDCGDAAQSRAEIRAGTGPCASGLNLFLEGQPSFIPLTVLPRTTVTVGGVEREAIALPELLPAELLEPASQNGRFTSAELRLLYDLRLGDEVSANRVVVTPEAAGTGYLLVEGRGVLLADGSQPLDGLCHVEALRRLRVTRVDAPAPTPVTLHLAELPTVPFVDGVEERTAITFAAIVDAAAVLGAMETPDVFDYRLVPVDHTGPLEAAVRFPWAHAHLASMLWVPELGRTRSVDTVGDLESPAGGATYGGVAASGWSSVRQLLDVVMEPAPDPAHTATGPDGPCTDPAWCVGCHREGVAIAIPVACDQCHPR
jgi:hypothetical protein